MKISLQLLKITIAGLAIIPTSKGIWQASSPITRIYPKQELLSNSQIILNKTYYNQIRFFSDKNIPHEDHKYYQELVMNKLDLKEWMRERFRHEMEKNRNNEEIVKIYNFYLELLDSNYFCLEEKDMNNLLKKVKDDPKYLPYTAICSHLRIEASKEIERFAKKCEELEKNGYKIVRAGPRGIISK